MEKIECFAPIMDSTCEVLILGSMPSKKSREVNFYYGNPTNRFWKIMSVIFAEDFVSCDNKGKARLLVEHKVGLFDVYQSCQMKVDGSLDSNITGQKLNDIPQLVMGTAVKKIFITSKKAYGDFCKAFGKYFAEQGVAVVNLPSPSSANRFKFRTDEQLVQEWQRLMK